MNIDRTMDDVPAIVRPTSWKTALVAVPLAVVIGFVLGAVLVAWVPVPEAMILFALIVAWYLSRRPSPSDVIGTGAVILIAPVLSFPFAVFGIPFLADGGTNPLVGSVGVFLTGGMSLLAAAPLAVIAFLAFRHN